MWISKETLSIETSVKFVGQAIHICKASMDSYWTVALGSLCVLWYLLSLFLEENNNNGCAWCVYFLDFDISNNPLNYNITLIKCKGKCEIVFLGISTFNGI